MKTIIITDEKLIIDYHQTMDLKIVVKKGIKASMIELFLNAKENDIYYKRIIEVEDSASLKYVKYQDIHNNFQINYALHLLLDATLDITNFELGLGINSNHYSAVLNYDHAQFNLNSLVRLYQNSQSTSNINTTHNAKNCLSNLNYKHSLHDKSKAIFQAKTVVNSTALYSKAFQNSDTILLSDDATVFAQPHLEILVDELEASHGATTGNLNKDELFYLQSRGIEQNKASQILLKAFENEIYDNINHSEIQTFLTHFKRSDYV